MTRADRVASSLLLVSAVVGAAATWLPWHSVGYGLVEVRGIDRVEGEVLVLALVVAAALAARNLLAGGPVRARELVASTAVAVGAAAVYVYVMARPESAIHELVRKGLSGTFCPGIAVACAGALSAFLLSLAGLRRSRTPGEQ